MASQPRTPFTPAPGTPFTTLKPQSGGSAFDGPSSAFGMPKPPTDAQAPKTLVPGARLAGERVRALIYKACRLLGVDPTKVLEPEVDDPENSAMTGILSAVKAHVAATTHRERETGMWDPDGELYLMVKDWVHPSVASLAHTGPLVFWLSGSGQLMSAAGDQYNDQIMAATGVVFFTKNPQARTARTEYQCGFIPWAHNKSEFLGSLYDLARRAVGRSLTVSDAREKALEACDKFHPQQTGDSTSKSPALVGSPGMDGSASSASAVSRSPEGSLESLGLEAMLRNMHESHFSFDKAGMHVVRHIKQVLAKYVDPDSVLLDEALFWMAHAKELASLLHQLQTSEAVGLIAEGLQQAQSPVYAKYMTLLGNLQVKSQQHLEWVFHLAPVVEDFRCMTFINMGLEHALLARAFGEVFMTIQCLAETSDYCTPARLVSVVTRFASKLEELSLQHLLQERIVKVADIRHQIESLCLFKAEFLKMRDVCEAFRSFPSNAPFAKYDASIEKLRDIVEVLLTKEFFEENMPQLRSIQTKSNGIRNAVVKAAGSGNALLALDEEAFGREFVAFKAKVKETELQLGALCEEAIRETSIVESCVAVMTAFYPVKDRRYFKPVWTRCVHSVTATFTKELGAVRAVLEATFSDSAPRLAKGLPVCASCYSLGHGLLKRAALSPELAMIVTSDTVRRESEALCGKIQDLVNANISSRLDAAAKAATTLENALIEQDMDTGEYSVLICPVLSEINKEVAAIRRQQSDFELLPQLDDMHKQWASVRWRQQRLEQIVNAYNESLKSVPEEWGLLLEIEVQRVEDIFSRGCKKEAQYVQAYEQTKQISWWGGVEVENYISEAETAAADFEKAVGILRTPIAAVSKAFEDFDKSDDLFPFDADSGNRTLRLSDEWGPFYALKRKERRTQLSSITTGLISHITAELNEHRPGCEAVHAWSEGWLDFSAYVAGEVRKNLRHVRLAALKRYQQQLSNDTPRTPMISFSLILDGGAVVFHPARDQVRQTMDMIKQDILQYPYLVPMAEFANHGGGYEVELDKIAKDIDRLVSDALVEADKLVPIFEGHAGAWTTKEINQEYLDAHFEGQEKHEVLAQNWDTFSTLIATCVKAGKELRAIPSGFTFGGWLLLSVKPIKTIVAGRAGAVYRTTVDYMVGLIEHILHDIESFVKNMNEKILAVQGHADTVALYRLLEMARDTKSTEDLLPAKLNPLLPTLKILQTNQSLPQKVLHQYHERILDVPSKWKAVNHQLALAQGAVTGVLDREVVRVLQEYEVNKENIIGYIDNSQHTVPAAMVWMAKEPYRALSSRLLELTQMVRHEEAIIQKCEVLGLGQSPSQDLVTHVKMTHDYKQLWDVVYHVQTSLQEWEDMAFRDLRPDALANVVAGLEGVLLQNGSCKHYQLYQEVSDVLNTWKLTMPLFDILCGAPLKNRHWTQLLQNHRTKPALPLSPGNPFAVTLSSPEIAVTFGNNAAPTPLALPAASDAPPPAGDVMLETLKVKTVIDAQLGGDDELLQVIIRKANEEQNVEDVVSEISARWTTLRLPTKWAGGWLKTWILDPERTNEYIALAKSDQMSLGTISHHPGAMCNLANVLDWLVNVGRIQDTLEAWHDVQYRWLTVLQAIKGAGGERGQLASVRSLLDTYRKKMAELQMDVAANLLAKVNRMSEFLQQKEHGLEGSIARHEELLRSSIGGWVQADPRFGTIPFEDLVRIFSVGHVPAKALQYFWTFSPGCQKIKILDQVSLPVKFYTEVTGVASACGSDELDFKAPFACEGDVQQYFSGLLQAVEAAVKAAVANTWVYVHEVPRLDWCVVKFTQVTSITARLAFTVDVEAAFNQMEDGNMLAMRNLHEGIRSTIDATVKKLQNFGKESNTIMHLANVMLQKATLDVGGFSDPEASKSQHVKKRLICLLLTDIHHRDVVQSIVDQKAEQVADYAWASHAKLRWDEQHNRPFAAIMSTERINYGFEFIALHRHGVPHVITPQTSRCRTMFLLSLQSATVAAVAGSSAVGKTCLARDLAASFGIHCVVVTGCESLSIAYLTIAFESIKKLSSWLILARVDEMKPRVHTLLSQHIEDLSYDKKAGRTQSVVACTLHVRQHACQIPEVLRKQCRLIAVMPINIELVATMLLTALGLTQPHAIAVKVACYFQHVGALALGQDEINYPTLRCLLLDINNRRKATSETHAAKGALMHAHIHSLQPNEAAVASRVLTALFPNEGEDFVNLAYLPPALQKLGYSGGKGNAFASACVRFTTTANLRQAMCVFGPPGCGKSVLLKVCMETMELSKPRNLYPAAMTVPDFLECLGNVAVGRVLVLDGAPGPWLDSLGPRLATGEALESQIFIETTGVETVTPGIMSRLGLVSVAEQDVGWLGIKDRWISTLPSAYRTSIDHLCDAHFALVFEFRQKHLPQASQVNLQETIQITVEAIIFSVNSVHDIAASAFACAVLWSMAALVATEAQEKALVHWWKTAFPVNYAIPEVPTGCNPLETFSATFGSFFEGGATPPERMQSVLEAKRDVSLTEHQKSVLGYISLLHTVPRSILYTGGRGAGKTTLLSTVSTGTYRFHFVSGTSCTTVDELSTDGHFDRHTVITVDDVNVVPKNVTETMRGWLETKFGFAFLCSALDDTFNARLARQMTHICLTREQELWGSMFGSVLHHFTGNSGEKKFAEAVREVVPHLPGLTAALAERIDGNAFFIPRSVTDIVRAIAERLRAVSEKVAQGKLDLLRQWQYAARRVLLDALQEGTAMGAIEKEIAGLPGQEGVLEAGEALGPSQTHYIASRVLQSQDSGVFKGNKKKLAAGLDAKLKITHHEMLKAIESIPNILGGCFYHGRRIIGEGTAALHVARVADLLCSSSTLLVIHGGWGVGKQTVALLAARICGMQPTIYDGHALDMKHCHCLIVKESLLRSNSIFHVLTQTRQLQAKKTRQTKVILLCTSASNMPSVAREYPSFFVGAQLYYQAPMSPDTLTAMARRVLYESKHFGDAKVIAHLAAYCTKIHLSAKAHAKGFSARTFFDMLWLMIEWVDEMVESDRVHKRVVQEGLEKLRDASGQVGRLQEKLQSDTAAMSAQGRMTKKLQEKLELAKRALNEHKAQLMVEENAHRTANDEHKKLLREHSKALEQMKPLLEKAQLAIKAIDKTMISDLRSIAKPGPDVIHVCAAAVALSCETKNVNRDKSWNTLKKMMVMPSQFLQPLIQLDVKAIVPIAVEYVSALMRDPKSNFNPQQLATKSTACMYVCTWVLTMMKLYECRMAIKPTEDRMMDLKAIIENSGVELKKLRDRENFLNVGVGTVAAELRASEDKQQRLRHSIFESQARLGRMNALMESLGKDGDWTSTKITELQWGLGDVALAASLVTHGAALNDTVRETLVRGEWIADLAERDLPVAQPYLPLIKPSVMARWERNGLPSYKSAHESAYAVTRCRRYPLLLDPHNQGTNWVKNHYKEYLVTSPSMDDCMAVIKKCLRDDQPLVITNLLQELDPRLDELLERSSSMANSRHRKINIQGEEYTIGEKFRLICTTPTVQSELPEKLLKWFTVVSFDISREGLEELLLSAVVSAGNAELEAQHQKLIDDMNQRIIEMEEAENCLLSTLSGADTDLIDRPEIITAINKMKTEAASLDKASQQSHKRREVLVKKREKHRRSIRRAVLFFMEGQAMEKIKRIYAFSITHFVKSFSATYSEALKQEQEEIDAFEAEVKGSNDESIAAMATKTVYMQLAAGLQQQDKLFFAAAFCLSIVSTEDPELAPPNLLPVLINGPAPIEDTAQSRVPYLGNDVWRRLLALEETCPASFRGLTSDIVAYPRWAQWYAHPTAETEAIPGEWQALSPFKRLLIIRVLRPDRAPGAMAQFVVEHLGEVYVNPPSPLMDLKPVLLSTQFLILWASAPCSPTITVKKVHAYLAARPSMASPTFAPSQLECLDLRAPDETLQKLHRLTQEGGSCFLEAVHLFPTLLTHIAELLSAASRDGLHPQFQFIATADPDQADGIPIDIIRRSRKICADGSRGLKAVLTENWGAWGGNASVSGGKGDVPRAKADSLQFLIVYFHSLLQGRNVYPHGGFSRPAYNFMLPDEAHIRPVLDGWLSSQRPLAVSDLCTILVDHYYALQMPDPNDAAIAAALGAAVFTNDHMAECGGISITYSPASSIAFRVEQAMWTERDELELLGVAPATLLRGAESVVEICDGMRRLAGLPEAAELGTPPVDAAYLMENLPPLLAHEQQADGQLDEDMTRGKREPIAGTDALHQAKTFMWFEEVNTLNALQRTVYRDLTSWSTAERAHIMETIERRCVPERWLEVGFDSDLSLGAWFRSLLRRHQFLKAWLGDPVAPPVVMLHLLLKPTRFLFYTLVNSMRPERASLESYRFTAQVSKKTSWRFDTPARNGVHVWGIHLVFASWDNLNRCVELPPPTLVHTPLPILTLKVVDGQTPTPARDSSALAEWDCHLYTTGLRRRKVLSFPLPTKLTPEQWCLWNACAVLETGDEGPSLAPPQTQRQSCQ